MPLFAPALDRRLALAAAASLAAGPALARAPLVGAPAPGVHRVRIGRIEVTAILDGHLDIGHQLFPAATEAEANGLTDNAGLARGPVKTPVNTYLVNDGERLVMVDAGTAGAMGPILGHMPRNLAAAGVAPEQVDMVVLTHLHPDHAGGLVTQTGQAFFPNAEIVVAEAEVAFWRNDQIMAQVPPDVQGFFRLARAAIKPYADAGRMRVLARDTDLGRGLVTIAAPGHTPGHMMVQVASGNERLLVWGDMVHVAAYQVPRPDWTVAFDVDQPMAAQTRRRVFDMVATDRIPVAGMHMPFPGLGTLVRDGAGYRFAPMPWMTF